MKFARDGRVAALALLAVLVAAALAFLLGGYADQRTEGYENVSPERARRMINSGSLVIVDVRTREEFRNGHIPDAVMFPIEELRDSTFFEVSKDAEVLVYCRSGNRSVTAAEYLTKFGYSNIHSLSGGILGWENQGYPIVKSLENRSTCPCEK